MSSSATVSGASVLGAASIWVLGKVAGPRRRAVVLHAGPDSVYLDLHGSCLALLSARGVQVPCGVRTGLPALPETRIGAEAVVDRGSIELPGCEVLVDTIVDTTVPVLDPRRARSGGARLAELVDGPLGHMRSLLPTDALDGLAAAEPEAVPVLLGRGEGLTPLGDDVLAGWLATAVASRHPGLPAIRSAVALSANDRTTVPSATLLACAARGEGLPEFRSLLGGIATEDDPVLERSVDLLLAIGVPSGAGLLLGALLALRQTAGEKATG